MRFLIIERGVTPPPEEVFELGAATVDYFKGLVKAGKIEVLYSLIGQPAMVYIADVDSGRELDLMLSESPTFHYQTREIIPLAPIPGITG